MSQEDLLKRVEELEQKLRRVRKVAEANYHHPVPSVFRIVEMILDYTKEGT